MNNMMNPIQMIKMMSGKMTPQQMVMNMVGKNNNPMLNNLMQMAQNGDTESLQNFAKNMFKEQGRDFDKEFSEFMNNFNGGIDKNS